MTARHDEDGSASIWVLALGAVLIAAALLAVVRGSAVLARHRLEHAADLVALAAAQAIGTASDPCRAADRLAADGPGRLVACTVTLAPSGRVGIVEVELSQPVSLPLAGTTTVRAKARAARLAGPVTGLAGTGTGS